MRGAGTTPLTMATSSTSAAATAPRRWRQTFSADGERAWPLRREYAALAAILVLSGLLEFVKLAQNGYANVYYSAAVKSMLRSFHNFFYVAADPNGLITVDKPPLGLWLQAISAKIFGFSALSLLIPEGICAVLAVALLYRIVAPRFGKVAALVSAFTLAVFPSFVAVSRDNGLDPLLILLMLAACGAALSAIDSGRLRQLIWCGVFVGLAFNTKALAAFLVVPGIGLGYLVCAPGSLRRRLAQLAAAGSRDARRRGVLEHRRRVDARVAAPVHRQHVHQLRAVARLRLQRIRPRRRRAGRPRFHEEVSGRRAAAARASRRRRPAQRDRAALPRGAPRSPPPQAAGPPSRATTAARAPASAAAGRRSRSRARTSLRCGSSDAGSATRQGGTWCLRSSG